MSAPRQRIGGNARNDHSRARLRHLAVLAVVALSLFGCGGDSSPEDTAAGAEASAPSPSPSSTPDPGPTDRPDATEPSALPATTGTSGPEEATVPFPATALPVAAEVVFEQPVWSMIAVDDYVVLATDVGIVRYDPRTGEQREVSFVGLDEYRAEPFWTVAAGGHVVTVADTTTQASFGLVVSVDVHSMEITGVERAPSPGVPLFPEPEGGAEGSVLIGSADGLFLSDSATLERIEAVTIGQPGDALHRSGDLVWYFSPDGSAGAFDLAEGIDVAQFDLGRPLSPFASHVAAAGPTDIWVADNVTATLVHVDTATQRAVGEIDLSERYGDAAVDVVPSASNDAIVTLIVTQDGQSWVVALEIDLATGEILWEHVVTMLGADSQMIESLADRFVAVVGDRMFARDHSRRIVEVDRDRLGTDTGAWVAAGLEPVGDLTPEEADVADVVRSFLDSGATVDLSHGEPLEAGPAFDAKYGDLDTWHISTVTVTDDRAWVRVRPPSTTEAGFPIVLSRTDGTWRADERMFCYLEVDSFGLDAADDVAACAEAAADHT